MQFVRQRWADARAVRDRLRRALRLHGATGLLKLLPENFLYLLSLRRRRLRRTLDEFDRRFGVETALHRSVSTLDVPPDIAAHATRYEPIACMDDYLSSLDIIFERYTFIDYGCGKGRALLMASDYPFARIVGVEYSTELAAVARRNISVYRNRAQRCRAIEVAEGNAALFNRPEGPCLFFLHNPFDETILREVLERIGHGNSARRPPDYLVYVEPRHRSCVDADVGWEIASDRHSWVLYRSRTA